MKKIYSIIIGLLLLFPFSVDAKEGITNYFIDVKVEDNGDVYVKELFYLNGDFNGYERIINFENPYLSSFTGDRSSFEGSSIYNGDDIELISIKGIDESSNPSIDDLNKDGDLFEEAVYASSGEYGVYTINQTSTGYTYRIYNPSSKNKGFYLEYRIKNMAVVHNDIAELGYNIFSDEQNEYIDHLEMMIHLPNNKTELRAWGHGPLWGETKNINQEQVSLTIDELDANTAVDIRVVFDKEVVRNSLKFSNVDGLNTILEIEAEKAEEANAIRETAKEQIERKKILSKIMTFGFIAWIIGLVIYLIHLYKKYDKEYQATFQNDYYREFPSEDSPEIVGYLMNKKIGSNDLSASILNLIYQKKIDFEPLDKNDYKLTKIDSNVTELEQKLLNFLFRGSDSVTLSELKKVAKKNYDSFLSKYNSWLIAATKEAKSKNFYESQSGKYLGILYCIIGFIFVLISMTNYLNISYILYFIVSISSFIAMIYILSISKRTKTGNELYRKWNALKKFMLDFGNFSDKELPEIQLWEKYLVYAVTLGCATKLAKQMKIRLESMPEGTYNGDMINYNRFHNVLVFNSAISNSVSSSISAANSAKVAASSNSSSGGFGGGFSGGGGSFGGGGGGGRF